MDRDISTQQKSGKPNPGTHNKDNTSRQVFCMRFVMYFINRIKGQNYTINSIV